MKVTHILLCLGSIFFIGLLSCKNHDNANIDASKGTYFSIRQFAMDQYKTLNGQPIVLTKKVKLNGKTDSTYVAMDTLDWGAVFKTFFESDISDKKYLGRYNFSLFSDESSDTRNMEYEAKDDDLFTRKLLITMDPLNNRVKSIYIETRDSKGTGRSQKLFYKPAQLIQIQEYERSSVGPPKALVVEYEFKI